MFKDYFKIPVKEIRKRKLRSWLTLIGVFIGIAAIISLITLGQGLENAIEKQFQSLGNDKLFIFPKGGFWGMGSSEKLTEKDLDVIKGASGVKIATGMGYGFAKFEFNDQINYGFVSGISPEPEDMALIGEAQTWKIAEGRNLKKVDKHKVVLGYEHTQNDLFEKRVELGDKILINGQEFKAVGFLEKIGSPPDDQSAIIPLDTYKDLFDSKDEVGFIIAQSQLGDDPTKVAEVVKKELRKYRNVDEGEEDFEIQTPEQFLAAFGTILDIVQIVLIGIAAISLLVGGIGIMNTMYTSVLERTKEIGIMKALGARNSQIMWLFLIESGLYGLGGGVIGAVIGIGFAKLTELIFTIAVGPAFLAVKIDWLLVFGTLLFSFLAGCISGIAPARSASKQKPVDSLRYE
ncbi:MAG: ABC transporter permease [Nanoarchaeota archaeon]|nr:ABC transporter permease [Nanoarchaeota archaeon]MBU1632779.1 ABC transporter permease [Nanoarchaeota archaeon]MBU1876727.1 ABC transporter permease [Nanoarchaeota archaeon]